MKLEDLSISRQGKVVLINHQKYQIEYNLAKGTWNYSDNNGKSIIKNGFTHISFADGSTLKTVSPGFREFRTEPVETDVYGTYQTLHFIYENTSQQESPKKSKSNSSNQKSDEIEITSNSDSTDPPSTDLDEISNETDIRVHTYLTCYVEQPYVLLKVEVENRNNNPLCLANITLIDISAQHGGVQLDSNPSQYHLFLRTPPISPSATARHKIYDGFHFNRDNTVHPCQDGILYDTVSKKSLIFGFITNNKWWPRMQIGYEVSKRKSQQGLTSWSLYNDCENIECTSGKVVSSEIGYIDFSDDAKSSYNRYTERHTAVGITPTKQDTEISNESPFVIANKTDIGWSFSDDNMQGKMSSKVIKKEVELISQSPLFNRSLIGGIDYIHLESGWQPHPGTLSLNRDSFPDGMVSVVDIIHENGFKAGIRIDPFAIERNSDFLKRNPDACLRYKSSVSSESDKEIPAHVAAGEPVEVHLPGRENALSILDVSNPKTRKHVQRVIKKIVNEWGYDIVKVDLSSYTSGMMTVASNVTWYEKSLTSTELYRCALEILTDSIESTKNKAVLAGYNVIDGVSVGSFQLNYPQLRLKSVDHSDNWHQQKGMKHRLCRYAGYLNENGVFWNHVYGELAVDEPRPVNEAIVELTAAALSGASVQCANTPNQISEQRAKLVTKIFPLIGQAAKTVDVFDEILPRIWHLPIETERESWDLIGIFNWKDQQEDLQLNLDDLGLDPAKDYLVHDFWMRHYLGIVSKHVTLLNMGPRSAKLLCLREQQETPQILSTDMHYTQGSVEIISAGWDEHSQSYLIICQPPCQVEGSVFIHVPENYIPTSISAYGSDYKYIWDKPIYQLTFGATDSLMHASIQFMKTEGGSK